jgi:hypothetical protein
MVSPTELAIHQNEAVSADVVIATQSKPKRQAGQRVIKKIAENFQHTPKVSAVNPEIFTPESDSTKVDEVAWKKTETIRENLPFGSDQVTMIVAFDVATFLVEFDDNGDPKEGEDLKRLLRQLPDSEFEDTRSYWENICKLLETEKVRMIQRCVNSVFAIEWHVGFAVNASDGSIANRGAVVLRAVFNPLDEDLVVGAFTLSEKLQHMKETLQKPTHSDLAEGVTAFEIGPRLPFAEMIPDSADLDNLTIENRDYPEQQKIITPEEFLAVVVNCELPPHIAVQLLGDSVSMGLTPEEKINKPTVQLYF